MSPKRGEVIKVNLNPTQGREQKGEARPCLVVSNTKYNASRELAVVMPITSTVRPEIKTMILLPDELRVRGSVLVEQVRTVDLRTRWWKSTEEVLPEDWVDEVVDVLDAIIR